MFIDFENEYEFNKSPSSPNFDIIFKGEKIGEYDVSLRVIKDIKGEKIFQNVNNKEVSSKVVDINFGDVLTGKKKFNPKINSEVKKIERERESMYKRFQKLNKTEDSLRLKTYENVNQAKKIFKNFGIEYSELSSLDELDENDPNFRSKIIDIARNFSGDGSYYTLGEIIDRIKTFIAIRKNLTNENALGYLGLFTIMNFNRPRYSYGGLGFTYDLIRIFNRMDSMKDILVNIRDSSGKLKDIMSFQSHLELSQALDRLQDWKKINIFMRKIPTRQKSLIWKDGWYHPEIASSFEFLTTSIIDISKDETTLNSFLSKVSRIRTSEEFIKTISNLTKKEPWDFNYWMNKLENTRNVYVSWSNPEKSKIICIVFTYSAIKKIAYMTNWCIINKFLTFHTYSSKGMQCIIYDFTKKQSDRDSVIGFTVNNRLVVTDCHSKNDDSAYLPNDMYEKASTVYPYSMAQKAIKKEFIEMTLPKVMKKLDSSTWRFFKDKVSNFLSSNKYITKFLDFYD